MQLLVIIAEPIAADAAGLPELGLEEACINIGRYGKARSGGCKAALGARGIDTCAAVDAGARYPSIGASPRLAPLAALSLSASRCISSWPSHAPLQSCPLTRHATFVLKMMSASSTIRSTKLQQHIPHQLGLGISTSGTKRVHMAFPCSMSALEGVWAKIHPTVSGSQYEQSRFPDHEKMFAITRSEKFRVTLPGQAGVWRYERRRRADTWPMAGGRS